MDWMMVMKLMILLMLMNSDNDGDIHADDDEDENEERDDAFYSHSYQPPEEGEIEKDELQLLLNELVRTFSKTLACRSS